MREQEKMINNMVKMSFEQAGRLSLSFNTPEAEQENEEENNNVQRRFVKAREVKVMKDGKPVLHAKQFYDSAHPEKSQTKILKAKKEDERDEMKKELEEED